MSERSLNRHGQYSRHANTALVLPSQVVAQPIRREYKVKAAITEPSHQATVPGKPAYVPVIQKNVPKYLTPGGALEMLMPNPMTSKKRLIRIKGERFFMRSDRTAKMTRTIAARDSDEHLDSHGLQLIYILATIY